MKNREAGDSGLDARVGELREALAKLAATVMWQKVFPWLLKRGGLRQCCSCGAVRAEERGAQISKQLLGRQRTRSRKKWRSLLSRWSRRVLLEIGIADDAGEADRMNALSEVWDPSGTGETGLIVRSR